MSARPPPAPRKKTKGDRLSDLQEELERVRRSLEEKKEAIRTLIISLQRRGIPNELIPSMIVELQEELQQIHQRIRDIQAQIDHIQNPQVVLPPKRLFEGEGMGRHQYNEDLRQKIGEQRGKGVGRYVYKKLASILYKPKGWTGVKEDVPYPAEMPPKSMLINFANFAYEEASLAPKFFEGWVLVKSTDTLKFYKYGKKMIVAIRGTADGTDVVADAQLAVKGVRPSTRFQKDDKVMKEMKAKYPNFQFYGVGHSLGGAVLDGFIKNGDIIKGVSYNPAVEKSELESGKNYRIYMENDPLYNTMGKYGRVGEARKQEDLSMLDSKAAIQSLKAHLLSNFVGGAQEVISNEERNARNRGNKNNIAERKAVAKRPGEVFGAIRLDDVEDKMDELRISKNLLVKLPDDMDDEMIEWVQNNSHFLFTNLLTGEDYIINFKGMDNRQWTEMSQFLEDNAEEVEEDEEMDED